jgi:undecaprenyl-diphosphatase
LTYIEAIILGIIQGATEFLPVSSSGHLLLIPTLFNLTEPDLNAIAIAHLGTLVAVVAYFYSDLWSIFTGVISGLRRRQLMDSLESRLGWYIVVGSIPAVLAGLLFNSFLDSLLARPTTAAFLLIGTGIILVIGEQLVTGDKPISKMTWADSTVIGLVQALALLPGISRSGVTITAGLGRRLDRPSAARYSFLLGVPAIAGAGLLSIVDLSQAPDVSSQVPLLLVTFTVAAVVGYACIRFLMNWLRRRSLYLFAAYCFAFGFIYLILTSFG